MCHYHHFLPSSSSIAYTWNSTTSKTISGHHDTGSWKQTWYSYSSPSHLWSPPIYFMNEVWIFNRQFPATVISPTKKKSTKLLFFVTSSLYLSIYFILHNTSLSDHRPSQPHVWFSGDLHLCFGLFDWWWTGDWR
jgi:hypothetical protein